MANEKTVSKADLVGIVAEDTGLKKKDVKDVVDAVLDAISSNLESGAKVQLTGFGTFEVRERKARTGRSPANGAEIQIPASKSVGLKVSKLLKDSLN